MNVTFYSNFTKRKNSTLRPSGAGTVHTVRLKEHCALLQPVFIFEGQHFAYNYCIWNGRYYFVTDAVPVANNLYEVSCTVDVLATYRPEIAAYNAFVERAASSYDTLVTDALITQSNNIISMLTTQVNMPTAPGDIYVVPVYGRGGVLQYVFPNITDASVFFNTGQNFTINGDSVSEADWIRAISNSGWVFAGSDVTSYMGDMVYIPYLPPVQTPYVSTNVVKFGWYELQSITALNVLDPAHTKVKLTQALTDPGNVYSDFRAYDPRYSQYKIYLPGCGIYDVNAADAGKKDIKIDIMLDFLTMSVTYRLYHDNGTQIAMFEGKFSTGVPAMGAKMDVYGILQDTNAAANSMMSENFGGAAGSLVSVANKVFEPQVNARSAGNGNAATIKNFPHILYSVKNYASRDIPTAHAGRPLYSNVQLGTLSGFVKCGNAAVPIAGFDSEKEELNNYLNTGFYFE